MVAMDREVDFSNQGKHLNLLISISFVFSGFALSDGFETVGCDYEQIVMSSVFPLIDQQQ